MSGNQVLAETSQVDLYLVEEATYGVTPATARAQEMRFTSSGLKPNKETVASDEINETRDVQDLIRVADSAEGETPGELSLDGVWFKILELALSFDAGLGSWRTVGTPTPLAVSATGTKVVRSDGGSWVDDLFEENQHVRLRGFSNAANNGVFPVASVSATELTLGTGTGTLVDESAAVGPQVVGLPGQVVVGVSVAAVASGNKFTRASGSFVAAGFKAGAWVRALGFATAGNNTVHKIVSVSALELVVASTLSNDSASSAVAIFGCELSNGTTHKSATIEQRHSDAGTFHSYRGMRVNSFEVTLAAKEKIGVSVAWMGAEEEDDTSTFLDSVSKRSAVNKPVAASLSLGSIEIDGSTTTELIREVSFSIENNLEMQHVIGAGTPANITYGDFVLTGKLTTLFKNLDLYAKFKNHSDVALTVPIIDDNGDRIVINVPRFRFSGMSRDVGGKNQVVLAQGDYQALLDPVSGKTIRIHRIPA